MSVPVGVVPKDRQLQALVIEAWKIQSVAHLVHFARKMQSMRGMLTQGAEVCLPPGDRSAVKSSQVSLTHQALSATLWIAPSEGTSWPHPSFSHTV